MNHMAIRRSMLAIQLMVAQYEPYLRMLARTHARKAYQAKIGASDIVQQAMLQAVQGLDGFRGRTEAEFRGWLRQILAHHICHLDRDLHRDKRDIRREQSMEQKLAQSSMRLRGVAGWRGSNTKPARSPWRKRVAACRSSSAAARCPTRGNSASLFGRDEAKRRRRADAKIVRRDRGIAAPRNEDATIATG